MIDGKGGLCICQHRSSNHSNDEDGPCSNCDCKIFDGECYNCSHPRSEHSVTGKVCNHWSDMGEPCGCNNFEMVPSIL